MQRGLSAIAKLLVVTGVSFLQLFFCVYVHFFAVIVSSLCS